MRVDYDYKTRKHIVELSKDEIEKACRSDQGHNELIRDISDELIKYENRRNWIRKVFHSGETHANKGFITMLLSFCKSTMKGGDENI